MEKTSLKKESGREGFDRRAPDSPLRTLQRGPQAAFPAGAQIIFVNRYFYPDQAATSQLLSDVAFDLAEHCPVAVICSQSSYHDHAEPAEPRQSYRGVRIIRVRGRLGKRITGLLGRLIEFTTFLATATWTVWRTARPGDLVVAKTDPPLLGITVGIAARLRGARAVNWLQDVYPEIAVQLQVVGRYNPMIRLMAAARDRSLKSAAKNVVISAGMSRYFSRRVADANLIVHENWASDCIQPLPPSHSTLRRHYFGGDTLVLGYSGNLGRPHPPELMAAAGEALRRQNVHFLMIGGGLNMQRLKQQCAESRLNNWHFLPFQPQAQLSDSLAAADVHFILQDARLEGLLFPSKLIGVLAAGRPSLFIGDINGEVARLIEDHACGIAVRGDDLPALLLAIDRLQDATLRTMMGRRARRLYESRFASEKAKARWRKTLLELIEAPALDSKLAEIAPIDEKRAV